MREGSAHAAARRRRESVRQSSNRRGGGATGFHRCYEDITTTAAVGHGAAASTVDGRHCMQLWLGFHCLAFHRVLERGHREANTTYCITACSTNTTRDTNGVSSSITSTPPAILATAAVFAETRDLIREHVRTLLANHPPAAAR